MGIWERPEPAFLDKLQEVFGFDPPRKFGYDTVEAIRAMHAGQAKVFFALGGNFLRPRPIPNSPPTPCGTAADRPGLDQTQPRPPRHRPAGAHPALPGPKRDRPPGRRPAIGLRARTPWGSCNPRKATGSRPPSICSANRQSSPDWRGPSWTAHQAMVAVPWKQLVGDYDRIRDLIARVIPGFDRYNQRVRKPGGFYLPNAPAKVSFPPNPERQTSRSHPLPENHLEPGQLVMTTIRSHDQFNTTIYGLKDRYRGIHNGAAWCS